MTFIVSILTELTNLEGARGSLWLTFTGYINLIII